MSVFLNQYHPFDLVSQDCPELEFQFQDEVLSSEEFFKEWTSAYDIHELFFDAEGNYIHMVPVENSPDYFDFVTRVILESYSQADIEALSYHPQFTVTGTLRTIESYTEKMAPSKAKEEPAFEVYETLSSNPAYFQFMFSYANPVTGTELYCVSKDALQSIVQDSDFYTDLQLHPEIRGYQEIDSFIQDMLAHIEFVEGEYIYNCDGNCLQYAYYSLDFNQRQLPKTVAYPGPFRISRYDENYNEFLKSCLLFQGREAGNLTEKDIMGLRGPIIYSLVNEGGFEAYEAEGVFDQMHTHMLQQESQQYDPFNQTTMRLSDLTEQEFEALSEAKQIHVALKELESVLVNLDEPISKGSLFVDADDDAVAGEGWLSDLLMNNFVGTGFIEWLDLLSPTENAIDLVGVQEALLAMEVLGEADFVTLAYMREEGLFIDYRSERNDFFDAVIGIAPTAEFFDKQSERLNYEQKNILVATILDDPRAEGYVHRESEDKGQSADFYNLLSQEVSGRTLGLMHEAYTTPDSEAYARSVIAQDSLITELATSHPPEMVSMYMQVTPDYIGELFIAQRLDLTKVGLDPNLGMPLPVDICGKLKGSITYYTKKLAEKGALPKEFAEMFLHSIEGENLLDYIPLKAQFSLRIALESLNSVINTRQRTMEEMGHDWFRSSPWVDRIDATILALQQAIGDFGQNMPRIAEEYKPQLIHRRVLETEQPGLESYMEALNTATGEALRERDIFNVQEREGKSQYESNKVAVKNGVVIAASATAAIFTYGASLELMTAYTSTQFIGSAGAMTLSSYAGAATHIGTGYAVGTHEDKDFFTEVLPEAMTEGVMTAGGVGLGQATVSRLAKLSLAEKLETKIRGVARAADASEDGLTHISRMAEEVAVRGSTGLAVTGLHMITYRMEPNFKTALATFLLSGGVALAMRASGTANKIEEVMHSEKMTRLQGAYSMHSGRAYMVAGTETAREYGMEVVEEFMQSMIEDGYMTPDGMIGAFAGAFSEVGTGGSFAELNISQTDIDEYHQHLQSVHQQIQAHRQVQRQALSELSVAAEAVLNPQVPDGVSETNVHSAEHAAEPDQVRPEAELRQDIDEEHLDVGEINPDDLLEDDVDPDDLELVPESEIGIIDPYDLEEVPASKTAILDSVSVTQGQVVSVSGLSDVVPGFAELTRASPTLQSLLEKSQDVRIEFRDGRDMVYLPEQNTIVIGVNHPALNNAAQFMIQLCHELRHAQDMLMAETELEVNPAITKETFVEMALLAEEHALLGALLIADELEQAGLSEAIQIERNGQELPSRGIAARLATDEYGQILDFIRDYVRYENIVIDSKHTTYSEYYGGVYDSRQRGFYNITSDVNAQTEALEVLMGHMKSVPIGIGEDQTIVAYLRYRDGMWRIVSVGTQSVTTQTNPGTRVRPVGIENGNVVRGGSSIFVNDQLVAKLPVNLPTPKTKKSTLPDLDAVGRNQTTLKPMPELLRLGQRPDVSTLTTLSSTGVYLDADLNVVMSQDKASYRLTMTEANEYAIVSDSDTTLWVWQDQKWHPVQRGNIPFVLKDNDQLRPAERSDDYTNYHFHFPKPQRMPSSLRQAMQNYTGVEIALNNNLQRPAIINPPKIIELPGALLSYNGRQWVLENTGENAIVVIHPDGTRERVARDRKCVLKNGAQIYPRGQFSDGTPIPRDAYTFESISPKAPAQPQREIRGPAPIPVARSSQIGPDKSARLVEPERPSESQVVHNDGTLMAMPGRLVGDGRLDCNGYSIGQRVSVLRGHMGETNRALSHDWTVAGFTWDDRVIVQGRDRPEDSLIQKELSFEEIYAENEIYPDGGDISVINMFRRLGLALENDPVSKRMFLKLFGTNFQYSFRQNRVGNCFLIAVFRSLAADPQIFESMIRVGIEKTWKGYVVKVPLGSLNGQEILINKKDLKPTPNKNYGKPKKRSASGKIDDRKFLEPVQGPLGFKILEALYCKLVSGDFEAVADRNLIDDGGYSSDAIKLLLGDAVANNTLSASRNLKNYARQDQVHNYLVHHHPQRDSFVAGSLSRPDGDDTKTYTIKDQKGNPYMFYHSHAYSIDSVEVGYPSVADPKAPRTVVAVNLVNPHDNSKTIKVPYDVFLQAFRTLYANQVQLDRLFRDSSLSQD